MNTTNGSSSSGAVGVILLGILFLFGFLVFFVLRGSETSGGGGRDSSGAGGGGGGGDSDGATTTPIQLLTELRVDVVDKDTINIRKTVATFNTGAEFGYYIFTLYDEETLTIPYARQLRGVQYDVYTFMKETEDHDSYGYIWNGIAPVLDPNKKYWIRVQKSDSTMLRTPTIGKIEFTTPESFVQEVTPSDIQQAMEGGALQGFYEFAVGLTPDLISVFLITGLQRLQTNLQRRVLMDLVRKSLRDAAALSASSITKRLEILSKVNVKFKIFLNSLTPDKIATLGALVPEYINRWIAENPSGVGTADDLIRSKAAELGMSVDEAKKISQSVASRAAKVTGMIIKSLSVIEVALLYISFAGMIIDEKNIGNMQNWRFTQTSDLLAVKEKILEKQIESLKSGPGTNLFPGIAGPLFKYTNRELYEKLYYMEIDLLLLPKYSSESTAYTGVRGFLSLIAQTSPQTVAYYRSLTPTGYILTEDDINAIEALQPIIRLREIQAVFMTRFNQRFRNRPASSPGLDTWFYDAFKYSYLYDILDDTVYSTDMQRIATYILCRSEGGNPLKDGQCSYRTATECFNSYPWPMINRYDPTTENVRQTSPCPSSPSSGAPVCLDNSKSFGRTDFIYSEWRTPQLLRNDYPDGTDFTDDSNAANGVCAITPPTMRLYCDSLTKFDGSDRVIGRNNYNPYTGECTNTKKYCDAFGISYTDSMPVSEMAGRGSGPLPSCYQSEADRAGAIILGGSSLIQYINISNRFLGDYFNQVWGTDNSESEGEIRGRLQSAGVIAAGRSDAAQVRDFIKYTSSTDFLDSENISIIDFKVDTQGNIYCLYAYGITDGAIILIKYDRNFKPFENTEWKTGKSFAFRGPVENYLGCCLAVDELDAVYLLRTDINTFGVIQQKIVQYYGDSGEINPSFASGLNGISPESLTEPGKPLAGLTMNTAESRFNGIFVKGNFLYVTYTGQKADRSANYSKFLKYDKGTGALIQDMFPGRQDYLTESGVPPNEELFSFVVDDVGNHYSFFLNSGAGITGSKRLVKYDTSGNKSEIVISTLDQYDSDNKIVPNMNLIKYPSLCIDKLGKLIISTGLRVFSLNTNFTGLRTVTNMTQYDFFPSVSDIITTGYAEWEVSQMCIDANNNICQIIRRELYVNIGSERRAVKTIMNKIKPNAPIKLIKEISLTGITMGIDYIKFENLEFSNCFGHENVSMIIDPPPHTNRYTQPPSGPTNFGETTVGEINRYKAGSTSIELPVEMNKLLFRPGVEYSIELKINGKVVLSQSGISVDETVLNVGGDIVPKAPTGYMGQIIDGKLVEKGSGCVGNIIRFNTRFTPIGTRILELSSTDVPGLPQYAFANSEQIIIDGKLTSTIVYNLTFTVPFTSISRTIQFTGDYDSSDYTCGMHNEYEVCKHPSGARIKCLYPDTIHSRCEDYQEFAERTWGCSIM